MNLYSTISEISRINDFQKKALVKLGIHTVRDLLYHFPIRYGDVSKIQNISSLSKGIEAVIFGKITGLKTSKAYYKKIPMADGKITDETGSIKAVWFHQPYLAKMISEDSLVRVEGKVSERKGELYFSNPKIEKVVKTPIGVGDSLFGEEGEAHSLYPVYPESRGITSNWIFHILQKILKSDVVQKTNDPIPEYILKKYNLPKLETALIWIHFPRNHEDALSARKRFSFEEIFFIQLEKQKNKMAFKRNPAFKIESVRDDVRKFTDRFPFKPTNAQEKAIEAILEDFKKGSAMSRLLEGDVGSGKTLVASATAYAVTVIKPYGDHGHLQTAYMVPTEILAKQHFESFIKYFSHLPIQIGLLTGKGCRKFPSKIDPSGWTDISRAQLLKWVANGEISILIGTHALIQKTVKFKNLAYVIIDEQHRFGTAQRKELVRKDNIMPHLLSMTATPIPRTLALTMFGDLDLTLLDEMPQGRKPIITEIVTEGNRESMYEKVRTELRSGRQAYVICPRIDEPDPNKESAILAKSVKEEADRLKKGSFKDFKIGILHGKMTPSEKDRVMDEFKSHNIDILVATSVVEVGVNVENATVIIIEGAERFGLSQLHQLRGRVIRSKHQAFCFALTSNHSGKTFERLKALKTAKNGFELAEFDLMQRGAGELSGKKQWGLSDVAMEALRNLKMVEFARTEAKNIISEDPDLEKNSVLKKYLEIQEKIHFE